MRQLKLHTNVTHVRDPIYIYMGPINVCPTYGRIFYWFCFTFSRDSKDFYGNKSKASDKLYFLKKTKLPFIHFSSPSPRKLKNKLHIWNKLDRKQHSTTKQLTKILIKKKKILLQKLHLIQISGVTRTKPEHIIKKKKLWLKYFKKRNQYGF